MTLDWLSCILGILFGVGLGQWLRRAFQFVTGLAFPRPQPANTQSVAALQTSIHASLREASDRAAGHEAGHAVVGWNAPHYVTQITHVTIVPDGAGNAGLVSTTSPNPPMGPMSPDAYWDGVAFMLGGLAGETFLHGRARSGTACKDLVAARTLAEAIVALGAPEPWWGDRTHTGSAIRVGGMFTATPDAKACAVLDAGYRRARWILSTSERAYVRVVRALLERNTLTGVELAVLISREA